MKRSKRRFIISRFVSRRVDTSEMSRPSLRTSLLIHWRTNRHLVGLGSHLFSPFTKSCLSIECGGNGCCSDYFSDTVGHRYLSCERCVVFCVQSVSLQQNSRRAGVLYMTPLHKNQSATPLLVFLTRDLISY